MKILLIATYLPPYSGSANIRLLNYINYLNRLGNYIDVIGVDYPKNSIAYDKSLENAFDENIRIIRVKAGFIYNLFNRKKKISEINKEANISNRFVMNEVKAKINRFIRNNFLIPDSFIFWITPAFKEGVKLINNNKYDLIFSIHETPSSHLVAKKLKKKFPGIRWVGYWSDPWNGDSSLREKGVWLKKKIEEILEKKVVENVDKFLFTTRGTANFYVDKYKLDRDKVDIVFRGFSVETYKNYSKSLEIPKYIKKEKINIVHTGTIYNELRDIKPLSLAIDRLKKENYELYNKLNILFIGQFDSLKDEKELSKFECVNIVEFLPFNEAIKYVIKSNFLLLYGNKESTQVPGKLYEYIGSEAAIITILGSKEDELGYIMKEIDKGPIIENEEESIYDLLSKIEDLINQFDNNKWKKPCLRFTWDKVALDLANKLSK